MHDLQIKTKQLSERYYYVSVTSLGMEKTMMKKSPHSMALVLREN